MSTDRDAFARFEDHFEPDGVDPKTGMPKYRHQLYIRFTRPGLDTKREATEDDYEYYSEAYKLYQKRKAALDIENIDGYPLALWPAITPAEFNQLVEHGLVTVEQLAKVAERRGTNATKGIPEGIVQLSHRARRMIELQKTQGRYEAVISQLTAERDQLNEQLREANVQLSAANAVISTLQNRIAGIGTLLPEKAA